MEKNLKALHLIADMWNNTVNFIDVPRDLFVEVVEDLFDWSKPVILDSLETLMIEDTNSVGQRVSITDGITLLGKSYEVVDFNPGTMLVSFRLPSGEIASANIESFKSNII